MKRTGLTVTLLIILSALLYFSQFLLFRRPVDTEFYLLQDLAFLPINVLLVSIGLNAFITYRERNEKLNRVNILISEFFSESGNDAIRLLNGYVKNLDEVRICASEHRGWTDKEFTSFVKKIEKMYVDVDAGSGDLFVLRDRLLALKPNLLAMFENPNLLEHDRFTDMLWAVYHLMDELNSRDSLSGLPSPDMAHLSGDMKRAYTLLVVEWAYIMKHMKEKYPYLFSLAVRKNPFTASTVIFRE